MPRLSHTFEITAVDEEVVARIVAALHEVARSCRFDGRGWLLTPDEEAWARLEQRADELGLVGREEAGEPRGGAGTPAGDDGSAAAAPETALQLQSGRHLAPRSHYLVAELSPEGVPVDPARDTEKGWSGTGLTITSWDEAGTSSIDFAMPDTVGTNEPPVTWGTVAHDARAGLLTWTVQVRVPGRGTWLRSAGGTLRFDTGAWYTAVAEGGDPPARLHATHALADVRAWLAPTAGPDGRWSVEAVLDVRGRGVLRPLVAAAFWAVTASFRRQDRRATRRGAGEPTTRERLDRAARSWDRIARNAPRIPELLRELARAMAEAGPKR
ncbi:hypothetical protein A6A08_24230 [Nocardiopsis sp. TSRI0078]|uniref:hypothetical protein n=1 Tax=unclassified Nocardiopsis TaxID=2649073 RepID=UPI00093D1B24|nr:hypothetical protein [Nocardiopsis sp. TSRI0078]OKI20003.1 hypothetical protein A6A08_24230 [Nocardiopsis sp. TSRI0078]